jgi:uncharacterized protein YeaO (DUF488 family)
MAKSLRLRVIYEPLSPGDGRRFLVSPLWPRGLKKEACKLDGWLKERGPWDKLRRWFGHDPARCEEFQRRYFEELDQQPETCQALQSKRGRGPSFPSTRLATLNTTTPWP